MTSSDLKSILSPRNLTFSDFLNTIPIIENNSLSYNDFFENYLLKNQAVLIKNVAQNWESYNNWSQNNSPNFSYLLNKYSECAVTKYDCASKYYNSQKTEECSFKDYLHYWERFIKGETQELFYLKDWHLKNNLPEDNFYEVPTYFSSDWLNEYLCESGEDDYRFVYMGPKGTWTPFHADVFKSYSWSVNICGQKRWIILHPGEEEKLLDNLKNLPYDITENYKHLKHYEFLQNPGEAIFVPSGWYHQVWNTLDTISINHNWINGCNLANMYEALKSNLVDTRKEIDDCKDMENFEEHCQLILKSTFGMDYSSFFAFIKYICVKRLYGVATNHVKFDLVSIKNVLNLLAKDDCKIIGSLEIQHLLLKIDNILQ